MVTERSYFLMSHCCVFRWALLRPLASSYIACVRGSPNGTIGNFTNGAIGSQWYHWLTIGANGTIRRANGTVGITIGIIGITNGTIGITNGTIGRTLNDIGIPLVQLVEPSTHALVVLRFRVISAQNHFGPGFHGPKRFFNWDSSTRDSSANL